MILELKYIPFTSEVIVCGFVCLEKNYDEETWHLLKVTHCCKRIYQNNSLFRLLNYLKP